MDRRDFLDELWKINEETKRKKSELWCSYADSLSRFGVGDIVRDTHRNITCVIVKKIFRLDTTRHNPEEHPECLYRCDKLKVDGGRRKKPELYLIYDYVLELVKEAE